MAKRIKYNFLSCKINTGTEESPKMEPVYVEKSIPYSNANEAIAKSEAHNGQYTVEDDGAPAPAPDRLDQLEAQTTYTAMMTGTLMDGGGAV